METAASFEARFAPWSYPASLPPDNRRDSSRAAGNTPAKRPGSRYLGRARLARPAPCPAICSIEKGDGRIKRLCRWAPRQHSMNNPEKNRVAKAVVDRWCSFQEALCGTKRKYPTREFLSFAEAARSYIDLMRHDQLIHRDVANAINGLIEFLRLERKRVPGRILSEADRLGCLFFGGFDPHFEGDEPPGL